MRHWEWEKRIRNNSHIRFLKFKLQNHLMHYLLSISEVRRATFNFRQPETFFSYFHLCIVNSVLYSFFGKYLNVYVLHLLLSNRTLNLPKIKSKKINQKRRPIFNEFIGSNHTLQSTQTEISFKKGYPRSSEVYAFLYNRQK